jgi:hypothetical protein
VAFNDSHLPRVVPLEIAECLVQRQQILHAMFGSHGVSIQRNPYGISTPFIGTARDAVVDEHASHRASGHGKEMDAIVPGNSIEPKAQVRLVDDCRSVQRVALSLTLELTMGDCFQLRVDHREQLVCDVRFASCQLPK